MTMMSTYNQDMSTMMKMSTTSLRLVLVIALLILLGSRFLFSLLAELLVGRGVVRALLLGVLLNLEQVEPGVCHEPQVSRLDKNAVSPGTPLVVGKQPLQLLDVGHALRVDQVLEKRLVRLGHHQRGCLGLGMTIETQCGGVSELCVCVRVRQGEE